MFVNIRVCVDVVLSLPLLTFHVATILRKYLSILILSDEWSQRAEMAFWARSELGLLKDPPGSQKQTSRGIRPEDSILYAIETISGAATNQRRIDH